MIISEITVFANNDVIEVDSENAPNFWIGGAQNPSLNGQVNIPWAAPSGSPSGSGALLSVSEINSGSVHLYGHEGGHSPYGLIQGKYLAITINPDLESPLEPRSAKPLKRSKKQLYRGLPSGDPVILEGKVSVSIKVYPKNQ